MDKNKVLFYSLHYKQSQFFEDTVRRIANDGYQWAIILTGSPGPLHHCRVQHPMVDQYQSPPTSFDGGMIWLKQSRLFDHYPQAEYLVHIDNDCFLSGVNELHDYLQEFEEGSFDYACHLVGHTSAEKYTGPGQICHVPDQYFKLNAPGEPPTPEPHYENAYQILRRSVYEQLSVEEVGHHRRFLSGVHRVGGKFGAHRADYRWDYTNWGKEWFHVGHIMEKFDSIESGRDVSKYRADSEFDVFRAGFFAAQERCYGIDTYPEAIRFNLEMFLVNLGGREVALECWDRITKGTCMETWQGCK